MEYIYISFTEFLIFFDKHERWQIKSLEGNPPWDQNKKKTASPKERHQKWKEHLKNLVENTLIPW